MELHERLKQDREKAGLSVKSVAASLGVTRVQVWRMEKNADFVSVGRLKELATLYGTSAAVLLDDKLPNDDNGIAYEHIRMAVSAVNAKVKTYKDVYGRTIDDWIIVDAVEKVIRAHHRNYQRNPDANFSSIEYSALIEELFG